VFLRNDVIRFGCGRDVPWQSGHVEFVVDKAAVGQVFSEYFGLRCQAFH
jgi:hypothetical protein